MVNDKYITTMEIIDAILRDEVGNIDAKRQTAREYLQEYMIERNISRKDLDIWAGGLGSYTYKIYNKNCNPSRAIWLRVICALGMSVEEANRLLKLAGYSELYVKDTKDYWIYVGLKKKMSFLDIEELLNAEKLSLCD